MFWPFRKKVEGGPSPGGSPVIGPTGRADRRPRAVEPANHWPNAADPPEDWADPAVAAEYERLMRQRIETDEANREPSRAQRERERSEWKRFMVEQGWTDRPLNSYAQSVKVFPRIGAVRRDLVGLGVALEAWREQHRQDVEAIHGMDALMAGRYPMMEYYLGCINDYTSHAPGWEICPVLVDSRAEFMPGEDLIGCLQDELPAGLYGHVSAVMPE